MVWNADDIPDQTGRVAVVTGANGGLGLETARELARNGAHVVMAVRDLDKAKVAYLGLLGSVPGASVEVQELDLGALASIRGFAARVTTQHPAIDLMINNAGVMGTPRLETSNGLELQFGTNHLGHFALNALLMPAILRAEAARVVSVTSTGRHFRTKLDADDVGMTVDYDPWRAYGRSKMANLHYGVELNRRLEAAGARARSLVAHPGFSNTDLQARSARTSPGGRSQLFFHRAVQRVGMSPARGALPQLRAATDPGARGGELYTPRWVNSGPPVRRPILGRSRRPDEMRLLWEVSERETGIEFDVDAMAASGG
jgi:NAD(P)-dependent dehydrogenase (short-subunit alcohol dehydrogenase family)